MAHTLGENTFEAELTASNGAGDVPVKIRGASTQTAKLLVVEDSASSELFSVDGSGNAVVAGTVTSDTQTAQDTYLPLFSHLLANSAAVNASVVLVDSGLTVTLPIAGTYELDAVVMVVTAAAADVSLLWGGTATVTATVGTSDIVYMSGVQAASDGTVATLPKLLPTSWTTEVETMFANTGAHTSLPLHFKGILVATVAGTIKLQFTQGTSDASDTKIKAGSWLKMQRVA